MATLTMNVEREYFDLAAARTCSRRCTCLARWKRQAAELGRRAGRRPGDT
jgi:hypothetical protein